MYYKTFVHANAFSIVMERKLALTNSLYGRNDEMLLVSLPQGIALNLHVLDVVLSTQAGGLARQQQYRTSYAQLQAILQLSSCPRCAIAGYGINYKVQILIWCYCDRSRPGYL